MATEIVVWKAQREQSIQPFWLHFNKIFFFLKKDIFLKLKRKHVCKLHGSCRVVKKNHTAIISRCCRRVWPVWTRDTGVFTPTPTFSELMCIFFFLLFLHVSPRHAHAADAERCGSVTLSRRLRSALLWSGAAACDYNQGQGSLTAGCWGRHIWMPTCMSVQINE